MTVATAAELAQQLQATIHRTIPLSNAMHAVVRDYDGICLTVAAPLTPNINLHGNGFAGSLYSIAALCGWGMMYLQLIEAGIEGDIVLAEADIKYLAPERGELIARCNLVAHPDFGSALATLRSDGKARFPLVITVGDPASPVARLSGRYAVRKKK